jgi:hypothetical protein
MPPSYGNLIFTLWDRSSLTLDAIITNLLEEERRMENNDNLHVAQHKRTICREEEIQMKQSQ